MPRLVPLGSNRGERSIELETDGVLRIGRAEDNDVVLLNPTLSKYHARLTAIAGAVAIEDMGSKNGTFVDGRCVRRQALGHGCEVRFGNARYRFEQSEVLAGKQAKEAASSPVLLHATSELRRRSLVELLSSRGDESPSSKPLATRLGAAQTDDRLRLLLGCARLLGSPMAIEELLRGILELLFEAFDLDHAVVLMADSESGELAPRVHKSRDGGADGSGCEAEYSRNIVGYVQEHHVAALFADASQDPRLESARTQHHLSVRSSMCAPLEPRSELLGALYVSNGRSANRFTEADLDFLSAFANQAAVALESALMLERIQRLNSGLEEQVERRTEQLSSALRDLEEAQGQLVESEKRAMLGRLVAGIVHEVNSPLGAVRSSLDTLRRVMERSHAHLEQQSPAPAQKLAKALAAARGLWPMVDQGLTRLTGLMNALERFISLDRAGLRLFEIREGVEAAAALLTPNLPPGVQLEVDCAASVPRVTCEPARLNQAISALLANAVEAVGNGGRVCVRVRGSQRVVEISVIDDGCGIDPARIPGLLDFSFSSKGGRMRLGLGLPTCKKVVEELGGTIEVSSELGKGTRVVLSLPVGEGSAGGEVSGGDAVALGGQGAAPSSGNRVDGVRPLTSA